jgi:hypothetical protein
VVAKVYSEEQRLEALELYKQHGPSEASRRTGAPVKTIASWAARAGVQTSAPQKAADAIERQRLNWASQRLIEADAAGTDASEVRNKMLTLVRDEQTQKAQQLATVYGVLVDKAQLLSGSATSRSEITDSDTFSKQLDAYLQGKADAYEQEKA